MDPLFNLPFTQDSFHIYEAYSRKGTVVCWTMGGKVDHIDLLFALTAEIYFLLRYDNQEKHLGLVCLIFSKKYYVPLLLFVFAKKMLLIDVSSVPCLLIIYLKWQHGWAC